MVQNKGTLCPLARPSLFHTTKVDNIIVITKFFLKKKQMEQNLLHLLSIARIKLSICTQLLLTRCLSGCCLQRYIQGETCTRHSK